MNINLLSAPTGDEIYYHEKFHIMMESHFTYLRETKKLIPQSIEPQMAFKYEGDFNGVLDSLNIPKQFHYYILRLNGLNSPSDMQKDMLTINIPDLGEIELLKAVYKTKLINL